MLDQVVVAGIGAADGIACDGHGLAGAEVLICKGTCSRAAERDIVGAKLGDGGATAQDGSLVGVIDLGGSGDAGDGEVGLGDGAGCIVRIADAVVAAHVGIGGILDRHARSAHGLVAGARVLVQERFAACVVDQITRTRKGSHSAGAGSSQGAVIGLAGCAGGDGQRCFVDGRCNRTTGQRVIAVIQGQRAAAETAVAGGIGAGYAGAAGHRWL